MLLESGKGHSFLHNQKERKKERKKKEENSCEGTNILTISFSK
jgi:hypothetical protein